MVNLRQLDLLNQTELTNLSPLANLVALEDLDLGITDRVTDLSPLSSLTHLRKLRLESAIDNMNLTIGDLSPLSSLTELEDLSIFVDGIQDLNWLIPLTNLRVLKLWGEHAVYTDVDALSGLNQTGGTGTALHSL